ncbi:MAG: glycosyltransferase family 2 protein [Phycisphaerales bacterium]|nr:glycosyltransferase family 2 protein [Phycisphaerales bacterium]
MNDPMPSTADPRAAMVVGVCTYNRGPKIRRTLDALATLDRAGGRIAELVIIDNRSSDDTAAVVDDFIASGPAIPTRRIYEAQPGKIAAMRRLFRETGHPLLALTDDDCLPDPAWAARLLELLEREPRAGVVGGPVRNIWEAGPTPLALTYRQSLGHHERQPSRHRLQAPREFVIGASLGIRRAAIEASGWLEGCYLEARTGGKLECGAEDAEVCIRIRQAGWEIWYEPEAVIHHLIPEARQTVEYLARIRGAICRGEPKLHWLAEGRPPAAWADPHCRRARRLWLKTLLFDWRPSRRSIRLAERAGRMEGWAALQRELHAATMNAPAGPAPSPSA